MTDRELARHLGRSFVAALSLTVLIVTGIAWGEAATPVPPRTVDVIYVR